MTALFRRINPAQNFRITKHQIAKFLRIPEALIVKIESWLYVIFVIHCSTCLVEIKMFYFFILILGE
jgi:hypothetical protein